MLRTHRIRPTRTPDAVIIGGGPAGLAAAIALQRKGLQTLVVESMMPPVDKGCGEGLMPDALESLSQLGIHLSPDEGHPFEGLRFLNATHTVEGTFPIAAGIGIGIRRTALHQRMADRAVEVGVQLAWKSRAQLLPEGKLLVNGVPTPFAHLVGADGTTSRVRTWAGLDDSYEFSQRIGTRRHYRIQPWSSQVEVHWSKSGQLYITPVAADQVSVVFITPRAHFENEDFLDHFPQVQARLGNAPQLSPQRGGISATRRLKRVNTATVSLIGDASGSVDAITGEGLAMTFRQANVLASALATGKLHTYNKAHRQIARLPHAMARLILLMERYPILERNGMRALAANRHIFQDLVSVHVGARSLPRVALHRGPAMAWSLMTAGLHA